MLSEDEKWYCVSLRFFGDQIDLSRIGELLNLTPTSTGRKGDHMRGNPRYAKYRTNIWLYECPSDSNVPFEEQINAVLDLLEPRKAAVDEVLAIAGTQGEFYLGFASGNSQGGAHLSSGLLGRTSALGLNIQLDLYPPEADEASQPAPDGVGFT